MNCFEMFMTQSRKSHACVEMEVCSRRSQLRLDFSPCLCKIAKFNQVINTILHAFANDQAQDNKDNSFCKHI